APRAGGCTTRGRCARQGTRKGGLDMNTIGVLARPDLKEASAVLAELISWLRGRGVRACLEEKTAALAGSEPAATCLVASGRDVAGLADALVVLGGDGTLLAASRLLDKEIPVL